MNPRYFIFIISFLPYCLEAQLPSFSKSNPTYIYSGMDNMISIDLNGADPEFVSFKCPKSQRVSKYLDSLYAVYPFPTEEDIPIKLYYKNIIVEQKQIRVVPQLMLELVLTKETDGVIHAADLHNNTGFSLKPIGGDSPAHLVFRMISGSLMVNNPEGQILYSGQIRDVLFTEQIMNLFKKLPSGSKITVSNPRVVNNYNQTVQVASYKSWIVVE